MNYELTSERGAVRGWGSSATPPACFFIVTHGSMTDLDLGFWAVKPSEGASCFVPYFFFINLSIPSPWYAPPLSTVSFDV